jgi:cytoskeletal protein CcmA (bactofilin family)
MFNRDKTKTPDPVAVPMPRATDTPAMAPKPRTTGKSTMPSIVSEGLHVTGNLISDGDVQIDGSIQGDIQGKTLTVGSAGVVVGKITADEAVISGTVTGEIVARSIVLTRTARVQSDITQQTLTIEAGAEFEGRCKRLGAAGVPAAKPQIGYGDAASSAAEPAKVS